MKMVIDSNYLQAPALKKYLSEATENYAVLTDYAAMEAFKGESQVIYRSMKILAEHPQQVLILKSTQDVCGLGPFDTCRPDGLIDLDQTCGFPTFCQHLVRAQRGDRFIQAQLAEYGREAAAHMDRVLADMPQLNLGIKQIAATYTPQELKILRRREPFAPKMADKLMQHMMFLAAELFAAHPQVSQTPTGPEVRNTFIFRFAISAYALVLHKIETGGAGRAAPQKLRNDFVDIVFVTFASFFDGFLSADKKAQGIHAVVTYLLRQIFVTPETL